MNRGFGGKDDKKWHMTLEQCSEVKKMEAYKREVGRDEFCDR